MKKTVLFAAALVAASAVSAQTGEITSNRGENWLSQDGDWGLTFDAQPLLNYAGNLFNGNLSNGGASLTWANPMFAIQGKKLVDANTAYRGKLRIGFGSNKTTTLVNAIPQPTPVPNPPATVEDVTKNSNFNLVLGAGLEKRIGSTRVVGVYGGEAYVMLGSSKTTNEYGNALSAQNPDVTGRVTETKNGSTFGFGLGAFAGIEWFCAPKVSLSGEYTWGLMMSSTGYAENTTERWDPTANNNAGAVVTTTVEGPSK
ncbi:MAG: hypothetical protein KDC00_01125, partial [Flavobacteriales bacterium]|nr:hypothetical protein [Flavobacteriales bacterium]